MDATKEEHLEDQVNKLRDLLRRACMLLEGVTMSTDAYDDIIADIRKKGGI